MAEWLQRLKNGLKKSSTKLSTGLTDIFTKRKIDAQTLEELEEALISSDMGYQAAATVIEKFSKQKFDKEISPEEIKKSLAAIIAEDLKACEKPFEFGLQKPQVILMVGVNGAGKTTAIGKLAHKFKGKKITFIAGDTFRAAAVQQLKVWAERVSADFISGADGCDAAGLCFDGLSKTNLTEELKKIVRVIKKVLPEAPHHTLLCLDAATGQNALEQVKTFKEVADVNGLIINKLDGTAKAGILAAIAKEVPLPVYFIGIGEQIDDLTEFKAEDFADGLFDL